MNRIEGMTLIEVMISLTMSVLILTFISGIFLVAEKSHQTQVTLATIQENARIATELLSSDIRMTGYIGCPRLRDDLHINNEFLELTNKNKLSKYVDSQIKPDTDGITVRHANSAHTVLIKTMRGYSTLYTTLAPQFSENDVLLISNCKSAEILKVKTISRYQGMQKIVTTHPLARLYEQNAEVSHIEINSYFIAKTERNNNYGNPIYALYVKRFNQHAVEMVEGVEQMKINFNFIKHGRVLEQSMGEVDADAKIMGVSIFLILSSLTHSQISLKPWAIFIALRQVKE